MKIVVLVVRVLLGLMFFVFGLNNILHFMAMPPMPPSDGTTYSMILVHHGVMTFVGLLMVIAGLLLLVGRFVPLALVILGPIVVNILIYHALIAPEGGVKAAIPGIIATLLELMLIAVYRKSFYTLFAPAPETI